MKKIFNKLVRDKFIDIYKQDVAQKLTMQDYSARYLSSEETAEKLKDKLREETAEVFEAYAATDKTALKEELADVLEVIDAILFHNKISPEEVRTLRDIKREKKGGFESGLFLESIDYLDGKEPK